MIQEHSEKRATIRCDRAGCSRSHTVRFSALKPLGVVAQLCESAVKAGWTVPEDPNQPDVCVGCKNADKLNEWNRRVNAANAEAGR